MRDYGWAYVKDVQKVFVDPVPIKRGAFKGRIWIYLTRGRDENGKPIKGKRVKVHPHEIRCYPETEETHEAAA